MYSGALARNEALDQTKCEGRDWEVRGPEVGRRPRIGQIEAYEDRGPDLADDLQHVCLSGQQPKVWDHHFQEVQPAQAQKVHEWNPNRSNADAYELVERPWGAPNDAGVKRAEQKLIHCVSFSLNFFCSIGSRSQRFAPKSCERGTGRKLLATKSRTSSKRKQKTSSKRRWTKSWSCTIQICSKTWWRTLNVPIAANRPLRGAPAARTSGTVVGTAKLDPGRGTSLSATWSSRTRKTMKRDSKKSKKTIKKNKEQKDPWFRI